MSTPEGRELRRQWSTKPRKNPGRPKGVPDGYRKADIEPIREQAKKEAEKVVQIMSDKFDIDDGYAKEALQTAVEVMRTPGETRERLSAATGLDWTKAKPAAKSEVTIGKAGRISAASLLEDDEPEAETGS